VGINSTYRITLSSPAFLLDAWDDNQLRTWLEEHGIIQPKQKAKRDELLAKMKAVLPQRH
jgi:hypothetical protein